MANLLDDLKAQVEKRYADSKQNWRSRSMPADRAFDSGAMMAYMDVLNLIGNLNANPDS